jgi:hypothetical protein
MSLIALMLVAALQEIPESDLNPFVGEEEIIPSAFQGHWAPTLADCRENGTGGVTISKKGLEFYEADAVLLKATPVELFDAPNGKLAYTIHLLVAERNDMDVGTGKLRLTLSDGKLYATRIGAVTEAAQWKNGSIRCPAKL